MDQLWDILSGAPWWVYVVFVYLVGIGIKATKPRTIPIKRILLMPLFFVGLGVYGLYTKATLGMASLIPVWLGFLILGAFLGMREVRAWRISKDHRKGEITIPGNYSTLILVLLIFTIKFFWGYFYATHADISFTVYAIETLTSALITGFFVGRAGSFYQKYQQKG